MNTLESIISQEQIDQFHEDGYLIVRGLLSPEEAQGLRDRFAEIHENGTENYKPVPLDECDGDILRHYPRVMFPDRFDDLSRGYMLDRRLHSILRDLYGEEPLAAQSMFYFKPPGARGQALHQDDFYLKTKPGSCMAAWISVDAADRDNGGMFVVPGSHRIGVQCPHMADMSVSFTTEEVAIPEGLEAVPADMEAGDVMFFNGSVIHGSWPNASADRFRRALIYHYVPDSATEISHWYYPLHNFEGEEVIREASEDGGPCGMEESEAHRNAVASYGKEKKAGLEQGAIAG